MLIALYERAVGYYASMVGINAYHQPGVEAGKKVAAHVLAVRKSILEWFTNNPNHPINAKNLAMSLALEEQIDWVFKILESLAINLPESYIREMKEQPFEDTFCLKI